MVVADETRFLSVDDVARELHVNADTVRRWLRNGDLHGVLVSRQTGYRIERRELERFIDSRRTDPGKS
jgi:excisionase family DNA binding protein